MYQILKTYLRPHFRYVAATVFLVVVEYVLQIFFLLPQSKIIIDRGVLANDYGVIRNSALLMLALTVAVGICSALTAYTSARATAGFVAGLRRDCFHKGEQLSPQDFAALGESTIITRTMADVTQLQLMVINLLRVWLMVPVLILVELAMIARLNLTVFFLLAGIFAGLYGVALASCLIAAHLASIDSYGLNYTAPLSGRRAGSLLRLLLSPPFTLRRHTEAPDGAADRRASR